MGAKRDMAASGNYQEILRQDKYWRTREGVVIRISKMKSPHLLNTMALLERQAPKVALIYLASELRLVEFHEHSDFSLSEELWMDDPVRKMRLSPLYQAMLSRFLELVDAEVDD